MNWEGRKRYLNSGNLNCLMSYRHQSLININRTHFSFGFSEVPRLFVATVERGGRREIGQPAMSLTFSQSFLVRARPCPPQFLHILPHVSTTDAGAICGCWCYIKQGEFMKVQSMEVQNKNQNLKNPNLSDVWKNKRTIDIRTAIIKKKKKKKTEVFLLQNAGTILFLM